jgi:hypothetical protein
LYFSKPVAAIFYYSQKKDHQQKKEHHLKPLDLSLISIGEITQVEEFTKEQKQLITRKIKGVFH